MSLCNLCKRKVANYTCRRCGKHICRDCYFHHGICKECAKFLGKKYSLGSIVNVHAFSAYKTDKG